jgi:hypothetical protein
VVNTATTEKKKIDPIWPREKKQVINMGHHRFHQTKPFCRQTHTHPK